MLEASDNVVRRGWGINRMSISEQIKELRKMSQQYPVNIDIDLFDRTLNQAADTIESLSAKLADMERSAEDCENTKMIDGNRLLKDLEKESFTADLYEHGWDGQTVDFLLCLGDVERVINSYEP